MFLVDGLKDGWMKYQKEKNEPEADDHHHRRYERPVLLSIQYESSTSTEEVLSPQKPVVPSSVDSIRTD